MFDLHAFPGFVPKVWRDVDEYCATHATKSAGTQAVNIMVN